MKKPPKVLVLAIVFSLFSFCVVPVHAESTQRYTPILPEFLTLGNGVSIKPPLNTMGDAVKTFFSDYFTNPYLTVAYQGTHTDYYPAATLNAKFVGEDKKWSIMFIKLNLQQTQGFSFTVYDPLIHEISAAHPIAISSPPTTAEILTYNYDYASKSFSAPIISSFPLSSPLYFSYVLDSSSLSQSIASFPYYSKLFDHPFTVAPYQVVKPVSTSYYNWWLGTKRTNENDKQGQIRPPLGVNTDSSSSSGGGSSSSSPPSSDSGGSSSSSPPSSDSGGSSGKKVYFHHVLEGDPDKKDLIPPVIDDARSFGYPGNIQQANYRVPAIPGYEYCVKGASIYPVFFPLDKDSHHYVKYVKVGSSSGGDSSSSNPSSSSSPSSETPDPDDTNEKLVTFTINYFEQLPDGSRKPLVANPPYTYKKITAAKDSLFVHTPPYVKGYRPKLQQYLWTVQEGSEVEVTYLPVGSGSDDTSDTETFFPILPFEPWEEKFKSNTKDPWNGFDIFDGIFDGMFKPKPPFELPDSLEKPPASSNPFELDVPTVSNPFELDVPTVSNPFELNIPTVSNPFELDIPTVSDPFYMDIPKVSNPFER